MTDKMKDLTLADVHALKRLAEQGIEEELAVLLEKTNYLIEIDNIDLTPVCTAGKGQVSVIALIGVRLR